MLLSSVEPRGRSRRRLSSLAAAPEKLHECRPSGAGFAAHSGVSSGRSKLIWNDISSHKKSGERKSSDSKLASFVTRSTSPLRISEASSFPKHAALRFALPSDLSDSLSDMASLVFNAHSLYRCRIIEVAENGVISGLLHQVSLFGCHACWRQNATGPHLLGFMQCDLRTVHQGKISKAIV